jgi:hypothetical protein
MDHEVNGLLAIILVNKLAESRQSARESVVIVELRRTVQSDCRLRPKN